LPEDAITKSTRSKFEQLAMSYLVTHDFPSARVRFDIIAINILEGSKAFLRHHRDAFAIEA
jgi:putative endonuclease